ncbi:YfbR-like 5'-deoxynucleotidase, partial [Klebsiella pneumoniae]|uniref:YfbR-like 5'-deoxynucleotidase n=1 Tax=Klebsiella pneumoniae TaxID=573 RepID=UPI002351E55C
MAPIALAAAKSMGVSPYPFAMVVAMVAHALAAIKNRKFGGQVNAERIALLAMYHDASEVLTGDL